MLTRAPILGVRVRMPMIALIALGLTVSAMPSSGQDIGDNLSSGRVDIDDDLYELCLNSECGPLLIALTIQSEADSLAIRELEIKLHYAKLREEIAISERPNWAERFMAKYGFAIGAAIGVYVGAAAVN